MGVVRSVDPTSPQDKAMRLMELAASDQGEAREKNRGFTQVYGKGWDRVDALIVKHPGAARLWAMLAKHIDASCGAVVASQEVLAEMLGVSERTVRRLSAVLEGEGAIARIRIQGAVYAYAIDPTEVWAGFAEGKEYAAFTTRTLVRANGKAADTVRRKLMLMVRQGGPLVDRSKIADAARAADAIEISTDEQSENAG